MVSDATFSKIHRMFEGFILCIDSEPKMDSLGSVVIKSIYGFPYDENYNFSKEQVGKLVECIECNIERTMDNDLGWRADFLVANTIQNQSWAEQALESIGFKRVGPFVRPREEYTNKLTTWVLDCKAWRNSR